MCVSHRPSISILNLLASSRSISQFPSVWSVLTFHVPILSPLETLGLSIFVTGWHGVSDWWFVTFSLLTLLLGCFLQDPRTVLVFCIREFSDDFLLDVFFTASSVGVVLFGVALCTCGIGNESSGIFFAPLPLCCQWAATGTRGRNGEWTFMWGSNRRKDLEYNWARAQWLPSRVRCQLHTRGQATSLLLGVYFRCSFPTQNPC